MNKLINLFTNFFIKKNEIFMNKNTLIFFKKFKPKDIFKIIILIFFGKAVNFILSKVDLIW